MSLFHSLRHGTRSAGDINLPAVVRKGHGVLPQDCEVLRNEELQTGTQDCQSVARESTGSRRNPCNERADPQLYRQASRSPRKRQEGPQMRHQVAHLLARLRVDPTRGQEVRRSHEGLQDGAEDGSENTQILRDLSLLQVQLRDYEGYRDTKYTLLKLRPNARMSWISYATAFHLLGNHDMALKVTAQYIENNPPDAKFDYEHSELLMYQVMILREAQQPKEALEKLEENAKLIIDHVGYEETRAEILMEMGELEKAERQYWQLIKRNPERKIYYEQIEKCRMLKEEDTAGRLQVYTEARKLRPRASVPKQQPLKFLEGEELRNSLAPFIIDGVRKGVPSLLKNLIPLYSDVKKVAVIEQVLLDCVQKLEASGLGNAALDDSEHPDSPTVILWLYYFLAQHYDRLGNYTLAMKYIDQAFQHTPTLIEVLTAKARILKHMGDLREAAALMVQAQSLDTADRYINSKCAKYMLRAGEIKEAENMCGKFTRENTNPTECLTEMQCMWYQVERARAFNAAKDYGQALVNCHQINSHFDTFYEDQYDFHSYCVRKMTLTSYVKLLRLEDVMRYHDFYINGMKVAVKVYLRMLDRPKDFTEEKPVEGHENMTDAQILKAKRKAQKEKARKAAADAEEAKKQQKNKKKKDEDIEGVVIEKYDPEKLIKESKPLEEAMKFVAPILRLAQMKDIEAFILAFEVCLRRDKILLMLQCLIRAAKIDAAHPLLHVAKIKFLKYYQDKQYEGLMAEVVSTAAQKLFEGQLNPSEANENFKNAHINSFPHRVAVAEANVVIDVSSAAQVKNWLLKSLDDDKLSSLNLKNCTSLYDSIVYGRLGEWSKEETGQLTKRCQQLFKNANVFGGGSLAKNSSPASANCEGASTA
ncbi:hypothetical protein L596_018361 [Steinernema carpocapsae]|uniref:Uncharacterized protein n=1 Tax=Steinernema carpocapsae TaxID=34508 RepID=A0A4U5N574_STECR|nr:hypothetical protein L596_018361 [Steinernema carpocapsae]